MKVFRSLPESGDLAGPTTGTVGNFDGLHRGHVEILRRVREDARNSGRTAVLVTFDPHPARVLNPASAPPLLTTLDQKLELAAGHEMNVTVVIRFDESFASLGPIAFIQNILRKSLHMEKLFVGPNFLFGKGRRGNVDLLKKHAGRDGPEVVVLEPLRHRNDMINSSRIRSELLRGEIRLVMELLGRPYFIDGEVIAGRKIGRGLGVPTANLQVINEMLPPDGVYVTEAVLGKDTLPGVTNIGNRPTFEGAGHTVETHLLDFDRKIYGEAIRVRFLARLREERRFSSSDALREQIDSDLREARRFFEKN